MITKSAKGYRIAELRRINVYWLACEGKGRGERKGRGGALSSCGTRMRFFQEHELALFCTNELWWDWLSQNFWGARLTGV